MDRIAIYYHPLFVEHDTGDHPECKERLMVAKPVVERCGLDLEWITPEPAPLDHIALVHDASYIETIRQIAEEGGGRLDWDTVISPRSYDAAVMAAGAGLLAVERSLSVGQSSFLLERPPGHHASCARGMGFCLFNNIALAAKYALEVLGLERVLIFDWDVHHGNGTQATFYNDPRVLYISTHMAGHFPGTGMTRDVGSGDGVGYTVNVPLQCGEGDGAVRLVFETLVEPLTRAYQPQLLLVSAGYDPQEGDPLGGLTFSETSFQWMASYLLSLTRDVGVPGPVCFLEGGYVPDMLADSIVATLRGLLGDTPPFSPAATPDESADVREALEEAKPYWKGVL